MKPKLSGASRGQALALRGVKPWRFAVSSLVFGFRSAWNEELRVVSREFGNGLARLG